MRVVLSIAVLVATGLAGCAEVIGGPQGKVSDWSWETSEAMLPDFTGQGPSYPVLVMHSHVETSQRTIDDWEKNGYPVCFVAGVEVPWVGPEGVRDMAPCEGPAADVATGRIFVQRSDYDAWDAPVIMVQSDSCAGGVAPLYDAVQYRAAYHKFNVTWHGDHFTVDGHRLDRGEVLKVTYWIDKDSDLDRRFARVAFEYPGEWLESNIEPDPRYVQPEIPSQATVEPVLLEAFIDARPETLGHVLDDLVGDAPLADARIVIHNGGITELVITTGGDDATRWYLASKDAHTARILGNNSIEADGHPVADAARHLRDLPFESIRIPTGDSDTIRLEFTPSHAFSARAEGLLQEVGLEPMECDDCVYVWHGGYEWAPDAEPVDAAWAPTWRLSQYHTDGSDASALLQSVVKAS